MAQFNSYYMCDFCGKDILKNFKRVIIPVPTQKCSNENSIAYSTNVILWQRDICDDCAMRLATLIDLSMYRDKDHPIYTWAITHKEILNDGPAE